MISRLFLKPAEDLEQMTDCRRVFGSDASCEQKEKKTAAEMGGHRMSQIGRAIGKGASPLR